jgi:DNA replication protein DnaC
MAGRRRLPDIMGEALGWLQNESPIIVANGPLAEAGALPDEEPSPSAKVLAMHPQTQEFDPSLADKLADLRLAGMSKALKELSGSQRARAMSFEALLGELIKAEEAEREQRRLLNRLSKARIPYDEARPQDFAGGGGPSLSQDQLNELLDYAWLRQAKDLVVQGGANTGKTWLASILVRRACEQGWSALYRRLGALMRELAQARKDERRFARIRRNYLRADLLVLDDWGLERLPAWQSLDLFELLEGRHGRGSTVVITRLPQEQWADIFDQAPLSSSVLAELFGNAVERLAKMAIQVDLPEKNRPALGTIDSKPPLAGDSISKR